MAKRRTTIQHDEVVRLFAARLREVRRSRGMTQAELARRAAVTPAYVWRLEAAGAAPGIDLLARLASALGTTPSELLPNQDPPDTLALLQDQARQLFDRLLQAADRETLLVLNPLLARLLESQPETR